MQNIFKLISRHVHTKPATHISSADRIFREFKPNLNEEYFCDPKNLEEISTNIARRKGVGNIQLVHELKNKLKTVSNNGPDYHQIEKEYARELLRIPNQTHPDILKMQEDYKVIKTFGSKRSLNFKARDFQEITKRLNMVRTEHLGNVSGQRSYYVLGELAELEHALVRYTLENLVKKGFQLISVPDILPRNVIESCGMATSGERNQVYNLNAELHGPDLCLSGTSEMAIAQFLSNKVFPENDLPLKFITSSRCYRAETSSTAEERGIYRVHEFTKVEMFVVSTPEQSDSLLEEIKSIEEEHFLSLGFHLRTLDMAPHELGAQAYRKYDIEAWMPGRNMFGEISSCSNCTDYQSRRLNIKFSNNEGVHFTHTLNGTACAVPRMLIAIIETYQNDNGTIDIPKVLVKYMRDKTKMRKQKNIPELSLIKNKKKHKRELDEKILLEGNVEIKNKIDDCI